MHFDAAPSTIGIQSDELFLALVGQQSSIGALVFNSCFVRGARLRFDKRQHVLRHNRLAGTRVDGKFHQLPFFALLAE